MERGGREWEREEERKRQRRVRAACAGVFVFLAGKSRLAAADGGRRNGSGLQQPGAGSLVAAGRE